MFEKIKITEKRDIKILQQSSEIYFSAVCR